MTITWSNDVSPAEWITERLHPFGQDVGSLVPECFDAYARILHPTWRTEHGRRVKVRFSDLARETGVALGPTTRIDDVESIATGQIEPPLTGTLECGELNVLVTLFATATESPGSCWFGFWEGFGWMQGHPAIVELRRPQDEPLGPSPCTVPGAAPQGSRVQLPARPLALYGGQIDAAAAFCSPPFSQSPTLWWPEDHAWCVASEIDFHSTYVGGSRDLIQRVLHDERLDALQADVADRVSD